MPFLAGRAWFFGRTGFRLFLRFMAAGSLTVDHEPEFPGVTDVDSTEADLSGLDLSGLDLIQTASLKGFRLENAVLAAPNVRWGRLPDARPARN
jgi:hypothetical protein